MQAVHDPDDETKVSYVLSDRSVVESESMKKSKVWQRSKAAGQAIMDKADEHIDKIQDFSFSN